MFRVLVSDKMSKEGLAPLTSSDQIELVQMNVNEATDLDTFDAIIVRSATKVTEDVLTKMPNLKIIARAGVGVDNIDVTAATKKGIIVVNAPAGNTISTAEHTFAMMMALARKICLANASIKSGEWNRNAFSGMELLGKTLGIVGFGRIGSEIAKRAKAFEMSVLVYDPFLTTERAEKVGVAPTSLDELLEKADVISVHTPLNKETKGLLGAETLPRTKPGVLILNCARGGIVDEEALKIYIENGHVAGAALDVFVDEPTTNQALLALDQVIATPHIAASTAEAQLNVAVIVSEEVLNFANNKPVRNGVNLPAISRAAMAEIRPYYNLTKAMGQIISQCARMVVKEIEVKYSGDVAKLETSLTTRGLISGFLQPRVDWIINDVNAPVMAKEYGINYGEKVTSNTSGYANIIEVTVKGNEGVFTLQGTYVKEYGPRIVNINGFDVDFYPAGNVVVVEHFDRPGVIGNIGQFLGKNDINIAAMQVGRKAQGGEALTILVVDRTLPAELLKEFQTIPEINCVENLEFHI